LAVWGAEVVFEMLAGQQVFKVCKLRRLLGSGTGVS
jgi:hypothetical protein